MVKAQHRCPWQQGDQHGVHRRVRTGTDQVISQLGPQEQQQKENQEQQQKQKQKQQQKRPQPAA
jgi:hypothetical protein